MQSDDYHLDRALYYACRSDRERLCSQVPSGNGRVYRCLYDQKFNNMMSEAVSYCKQTQLNHFFYSIHLVSKRSSSTTIISCLKCDVRCTINSR